MPLEQQILDAIGDNEMHGYAIARRVSEQTGKKILPGHGTLYRALGRLVEMGRLTDRWEADSERVDAASRPRRRLYRRTRPAAQQQEAGE